MLSGRTRTIRDFPILVRIYATIVSGPSSAGGSSLLPTRLRPAVLAAATLTFVPIVRLIAGELSSSSLDCLLALARGLTPGARGGTRLAGIFFPGAGGDPFCFAPVELA